MTTTTYGDISQRTAAYAATEMLSHADSITVLSKYGLHKPVPKNKAQSVKFRRAIPFPLATTPLQEGVTPAGHKMAYEDVPATLKQYGDFVTITDVVQDEAEDPVLRDASQLNGEQAGSTLEAIIWGVLAAGTNVFRAGSVATRADIDASLDRGLQRKVTKGLKANKGKHITSMVGASVKISTEPVAPAFIALGHTDCESDIRDMDGFVPVEKYGSMKAMPYEIGKVEDCRYILTPELTPFASSGKGGKDVYPIIYLAKEAYGCVPLKGEESIEPKVLNPNTPRGGDPLGQRGTVGWKTYFTAVRLNELWMARVEVTLGQ
ncbi:N4-gp56 family major capsid protein [Endozoicomonas gorgoniicola]|uniref:N4-gp56 family major capsid protein n=1 Tax=Endozoicomonas gorgoniicola TaxID=1234144 RepID=A0ABT3N4F7_9GAMM|nr:N4-gp56 family major capsid protein [Endozoicomonas gorgoniicola]MCW7556491.1 N4-gp56 family major capsid protein [Endozoicomonas gorgoniicola]